MGARDALCRRLFGALVLVPAAIGMLTCTAGIIAVWVGQERLTQEIEAISARVDGGLQRVSEINQTVQRALEDARADVQQVRAESKNLGAGPQQNRDAATALRKLVHERLGPKINEIGGRMAVLSDAVTVAASLWESIQALPFAHSLGIDSPKFELTMDHATRLSAAASRIELKIGEEERAPIEQEVAASLTDVDFVLQRCRMTLEDRQIDLNSARDTAARSDRCNRSVCLGGRGSSKSVCAWLEVVSKCLNQSGRQADREPAAGEII